MAAGKLALGYVLSLTVAEDVFQGGVMVTDGVGLPLEFRYTEPVRATRLQRLLYGDVLEKYIHGDVVAGSLIGRLEQKPDIFLVGSPTLLEAISVAGKKVALLQPSTVSPLKELGATQDISETEYYLQITNSGAPARVRLSSRGGDPTLRAEITRVLTEAGRTMDVSEPLERVEAAIKMLWEDEGKKSPA